MANKLITSTMMDEQKLQHYGVKGQKWGVRHAPEQLGRDGGSKKEEKKDIKLNGLEDYLWGIGVSLVIGGVHHVASNAGNKRVMKKANKEDIQISKLNQASKISPPEPYLKTIKNCNNTKSINKNFKNNCPNTTLTYELRRRGYDVKAKPIPSGLSRLEIKNDYNIKDYDFKIDRLHSSFSNKKDNEVLSSYFKSLPDNYRGAVTVTWQGLRSGHIFNVEKINGKTIFIDAQSGKHGEFKGMSFAKSVGQELVNLSVPLVHLNNPANYLNNASDVMIFRTDNAKINETNLSDRITKGGKS